MLEADATAVKAVSIYKNTNQMSKIEVRGMKNCLIYLAPRPFHVHVLYTFKLVACLALHIRQQKYMTGMANFNTKDAERRDVAYLVLRATGASMHHCIDS